MRANSHGDLDLTREPLHEGRLTASDVILILTVLLALAPLGYFLLWHGLELAMVAEG